MEEKHQEHISAEASKNPIDKSFWILVVIFVLGLVLVGAWYIYSSNSQGSIPVACTTDAKQCSDGSYVGRVAPSCEFEECAEIEESSEKGEEDYLRHLLLDEGWQTYRNKEFGFEFMYPRNWKIIVGEENVGIQSPDTIEKFKKGEIDIPSDVVISVFNSGDTLETFVDGLQNGWYSLYAMRTSTSIYGKDAIYLDDSSASIPKLPVLAVFIKDDSRVVSISFFRAVGYDERELFDDILSSFKFFRFGEITIGFGYTKNDDNVFYMGTVLPSANPGIFRIEKIHGDGMEYTLGVSGNQVYYESTFLEGVDFDDIYVEKGGTIIRDMDTRWFATGSCLGIEEYVPESEIVDPDNYIFC